MVVIYCEKASQAKAIAEALHAGRKIVPADNKYIGHWEFDFKGEPSVICHGAGHLCTLFDAKDYDSEKYAKWNLTDFPCIPDDFSIKVPENSLSAFTYCKQFFDNCDRVINATDADREGELIFGFVYEKMNCSKPWQRAWILDLTPEKIRYAFDNLKSSDEMLPLQMAGRARSIADWLVGINLTIGMSVKFSSQHSKNVFNVGRVKTPTLNMIVERERAIQNHTKTPFWKLQAEFVTLKGKFIAEHQNGNFDNEQTATEILKKIEGKPGKVISIESKTETVSPPLLYNSTALQADAGKKYGWSVEKTMKLMQSLYEKKLMTYPRTSTEHLTEAMKPEISDTLQKIFEIPEYKALAPSEFEPFGKRHFDDEKVGSHTAVTPTLNVPNTLDDLSEDEKKLYHLLCISLIRIVHPKAVFENTTAEISVGGEIFKAKGKVTVNPGWQIVSQEKQTSDKVQTLPKIEKDEEYPGEYTLKQGFTEPPKRYTQPDLLTAMETAGKHIEDEEARTIMKMKKAGLGTDATRAAIITDLFNREYLAMKGKSIIPTEKAFFVIDHIPCANLKSAEFTGDWEKRLHEISTGAESYSLFIDEVKQQTMAWFDEIKSSEDTQFVSEEEKLMVCPACQKPVKKGKFGYFCTGYKDGCKFSIKDEIAGKKITQSQKMMLITSGKTKTIKGFTAKNGSTFDAALVVDKSTGAIKFQFADKKKG